MFQGQPDRAVSRRKTNMIEQELLTIKDVCTRYSIGRTTLYREAAAGRLRLRKMGTATRVARKDVEAWMSALPIVTGAAA